MYRGEMLQKGIITRVEKVIGGTAEVLKNKGYEFPRSYF